MVFVIAKSGLHHLIPLLLFSTYISGKLCSLLFLESACGPLCVMSFNSLSKFYLAFKAQFKWLLFHKTFNSPFFLFCFIPFPDTTLCLIKQGNSHIYITKNQTPIESSERDKWTGCESGKFVRTPMQYYELGHLGWVRRNGIQRNIRAMTNEYKCMQGERLSRLFAVSTLGDRMN